jgi:surface carbohydrate biosynthesis protein
MKSVKATLLVPVENQVRELDAKLLLTCIAARRGFSSVIGPRREVHFHLSALPKGIYLAKSMTIRSALLFRVARKLGHQVVAWDEEALVHLPFETYCSRRLSAASLQYVSHLFAWGEDNAELWRRYPQLPKGLEIHVTGNPRNDLLRSEVRHYYKEEVEALRKRYGDFILINTNFNHVNAFSVTQNLFQPTKDLRGELKFGRAATGMSREYAEGLRDHKQAIFGDFRRLIPAIARAFPECAIVVRPHPTENPNTYHEIAARCERVRVTNQGNVVPWLIATKALIHNGCTTGVEAFVMGVPAITYRATANDYYDYGFYRLPNLLSHQCFNFEELRGTLQRILAGELGAADGDERQELLDRYLAAREGPLACERMVDVLERMMEGRTGSPRPSASDRVEGWLVSTIHNLIKRSKARLPGSHGRPEFQLHRYPALSLEEMRARVSRFQQVLGDSRKLQVEHICKQLFRIDAEKKSAFAD